MSNKFNLKNLKISQLILYLNTISLLHIFFLLMIEPMAEFHVALLFYSLFTILPLLILWGFYFLKIKIQKKYMDIIFIIILIIISIIALLMLRTLLPLWENCGWTGCFSTNYWESSRFITY